MVLYLTVRADRGWLDGEGSTPHLIVIGTAAIVIITEAFDYDSEVEIRAFLVMGRCDVTQEAY